MCGAGRKPRTEYLRGLKATTLMTQSRWLFCVQHLMRLTERNNAYETVKAVGPGPPEERQPPPLEQQRQVVVSPHGTQAGLHRRAPSNSSTHPGHSGSPSTSGQALSRVDRRSLPKGGGSMKKYPGIDYNFRPDNYWYDETVLQSILRDV